MSSASVSSSGSPSGCSIMAMLCAAHLEDGKPSLHEMSLLCCALPLFSSKEGTPSRGVTVTQASKTSQYKHLEALFSKYGELPMQRGLPTQERFRGNCTTLVLAGLLNKLYGAKCTCNTPGA